MKGIRALIKKTPMRSLAVPCEGTAKGALYEPESELSLDKESGL